MLTAGVPESARARALLIAAEAAYGMRAHTHAAMRYRQYLVTRMPAELPRATYRLGWAEYRAGDRARARQAWTRLADTSPADPRAPLALMLAAEAARETGDVAAARALLDRVIDNYPPTPRTGVARLNRFIVTLRGERIDEALIDLDEVIRSSPTSVVDARMRLVTALAVPGAEDALDSQPSGLASGEGDDRLERFARAVLDTHDPETTPYLLHGLVLVAAADRGWADVLVDTLAGRLVDEFPAYPPAPALLTRVAASARAAGQWPIARRAHTRLIERYPANGTGRAARLELAETLLRAGAAAEARPLLEDAVTAGGDDAARALLLMAEMAEASGDRRAALAAYERVQQDHPRLERSAPSLLAHARLLQEMGHALRARPLLERAIAGADGEVAAEAAYRLARGFSAEGRHAAALDWYMTAAYAVQDSPWSRLALLEAGRAFTTLDEPQHALTVYRKLLPSPVVRARGSMPMPAPAARPEHRETNAEAAYRMAEILRGRGEHEEAADMYVSAAHLTAGSAAEHRALVGALRCLVTLGDRPSADAVYRRLQDARAVDPALLAEARNALRAGPASNTDRLKPVEWGPPRTAR